MKRIKFLAIAFASLFITANLTSCSKTDEEKDAEELIEEIKDGGDKSAQKTANRIIKKYYDEEDGLNSKEFKQFLEALDEEAADEGVVIKTAMIMKKAINSYNYDYDNDYDY